MNVQNLKPKACYEVFVVDKETAEEALKGIVQYLNLAFHPDHLASDYVQIENDNPTFEDFEAKNFDENLDKCCDFIDIYQRTIELWGELGMIDNETQQKLEGNDHSHYFDTKIE